MTRKDLFIVYLLVFLIIGLGCSYIGFNNKLTQVTSQNIQAIEMQNEKIEKLTVDIEALDQELGKVKRGNLTSRSMITRELRLPDNFKQAKHYMDYRCITDTSSNQWKLQQQAYTDGDGFRRIENDYLVAMGSFYVDKIGNRFIIELDSGKKITVRAGDMKSDNHTDSSNMTENGNLLEFIVDDNKISNTSKLHGDMSYSGLQGKIISIKKIY